MAICFQKRKGSSENKTTIFAGDVLSLFGGGVDEFDDLEMMNIKLQKHVFPTMLLARASRGSKDPKPRSHRSTFRNFEERLEIM